jgi:VIT1/CCC1 family predicted Fe2+/Mn2+ transporter
VLGANDEIILTSSLILGVASIVAGAMPMAAGEYVSVSSQADTEQAEIGGNPTHEHEELTAI